MNGDSRSNPAPARNSDVPRCGGDEGGYVLALTGLLLLPLLAFAGFAVDLGAWYSEAAKLQRTADAASLAAVSYMPREHDAEEAAREVLRRNGYDPDQAIYTPIGIDRYSVEITQTDVNQYFTTLFADEVVVTRNATAEFIQRVALGSPRNYIGTNTLISGSTTLQDKFWLSVNGPCSSREQGDWILPLTTANANSANPPTSAPWDRCTGGNTIPSPSYRNGRGYFYAVMVPEHYDGPSSQWIRVYDAAFCNHDSEASDSPSYRMDLNYSSSSDFRTTFNVRSGGNRLEPWANPIIATFSFDKGDNCGTSGTGCSSSWRSRWCGLYQMTGIEPGDMYFVEVTTSNVSTSATQQHYINSYALSVLQNATSNLTASNACSGDPSVNTPTGLFKTSCIRLYAIDHLSIITYLQGEDPEFYLAEIGDEHSGKTLEISLFDLGEGTINVEVLDPNGDPATFEWEVVDEQLTGISDTPPTGGWSGTANVLDTRGTWNTSNQCGVGNMQAGPRRLSDKKFNDRMVELKIELPDDIDEAYGGKYWWKIRYETGSGSGCVVQDRTTWGAGVKGDPVRLVD